MLLCPIDDCKRGKPLHTAIMRPVVIDDDDDNTYNKSLTTNAVFSISKNTA